MEELSKAFGEYVEEFKKLDIVKKREEVLRSINELVAIFEELGEMDNIKLEHLNVDDKLTGNLVTEEDFLTTELANLENAKNLIGQYLDKKN